MPLRHPLRPPRDAGFTLVEMLVATAITGGLLASLVIGLQMFGTHVEQVRAESEAGPDDALALMTDMSRHGWVVEGQTGQLVVTDPHGGQTVFAHDADADALTVTRPNGASGTLLAGVEAFHVDTETVRRLREDTPLDADRAWWEQVEPAGVAESLRVEDGLGVGLGFTMASEVPADYDTVADVREHAVFATLDRLALAVSYLATVPADPNEPVTGGSNGNGNGNKVQICHIPPGNPGNAHTISVNQNAVDAHLAHGDVLGDCSAVPPPTGNANLIVQLFEARGIQDARPHGPALASLSVPASSLPSGSAVWTSSTPGEHDSHDHASGGECYNTTPDGKVVICHVPPGNPSNAHTIEVSPNAAAAHLAHGDYYGCCGDHGGTTEVYALEISPPSVEVVLDLAGLGSVIEPGRAYTLVLGLQGPGVLAVRSLPSADVVHSGVAMAAEVDGDLEPQPLTVPFRLEGFQRITQTTGHDVASRVSLTLDLQDGRSLQGSASITGQTTVPSPWSGVVPSQTESLDL